MSGKPLLITDCDEVLLHMVSHFDAWLDERHGIHFDIESGSFGGAMTYRKSGEQVDEARVWPLLDEFFRTEMHRQTPVPGAIGALKAVGEVAEIVILTNIGDEAHPWRVAQLADHDIHHRVVCNSGGKGRAAKKIVAEEEADRIVFVDDLPIHHKSMAKHLPHSHRLHLIAEPRLATVIPPAEHAHARIDDWDEALPWIMERLTV